MGVSARAGVRRDGFQAALLPPYMCVIAEAILARRRTAYS
jgi:hypothetical protein